MKIILLQLCVLICCQAAVSDLLTDLGSNVTINCDLDENEIYWIVQKTPDPPTVILRSFSTPAPSYFNKSLRSKYSVLFKHRLVINNVTADELAVYYCMKTGTPPKFSNSSRIYITEADQKTECQNQTVLEFIEQNQTQYQTIIIITSAVVNGLLLILLIGLVKVFVIGNRRFTEQSGQMNTDLQQTQVTEQHQDPEQIQYATMDFSKFRKKMRSSQINTTYAALHLPKS